MPKTGTYHVVTDKGVYNFDGPEGMTDEQVRQHIGRQNAQSFVSGHGGRFGSTAMGVTQGALMNWAPEVLGTAHALDPFEQGSVYYGKPGADPLDIIRSNIERVRQMSQQYQAVHPGYYGGGEVGGTVGSLVAGGAALKGIAGGARLGMTAAEAAEAARAADAARVAARATPVAARLIPAAVRGAGMGAVTGGISGAGEAGPGHRLEGATRGEIAGGVGGAILGPLLEGAPPLVLAGLRMAKGTAAAKAAAQFVDKGLLKSGIDVMTQEGRDKLTAMAAKAGPNATLGDISDAMRARTFLALLDANPEATAAGREVYGARAADAPARMENLVKTTVGPTTAPAPTADPKNIFNAKNGNPKFVPASSDAHKALDNPAIQEILGGKDGLWAQANEEYATARTVDPKFAENMPHHQGPTDKLTVDQHLKLNDILQQRAAADGGRVAQSTADTHLNALEEAVPGLKDYNAASAADTAAQKSAQANADLLTTLKTKGANAVSAAPVGASDPAAFTQGLGQEQNLTRIRLPGYGEEVSQAAKEDVPLGLPWHVTNAPGWISMALRNAASAAQGTSRTAVASEAAPMLTSPTTAQAISDTINRLTANNENDAANALAAKYLSGAVTAAGGEAQGTEINRTANPGY